MSSPVCGGNFQNGFYRFDQDAKVYQYSNNTSLVENTPLNISSDTDLVTLIIKCVYNGADTIYFIGTTKNEATVSLYSAALNLSNTFNFQKIVDPTDGVLDAESTTLFSVDKWPDCKRCVMVQYNTNSIGITGPNSFSPNINMNKAYNISSVKTSFITQNGKMYQLLPQGLKSYMFDITKDNKITTSSALYQFENSNIVNSNIAWQTASSEDSSQILFYDSGSNFQLLKLDNQTSTAKMINNTYMDMKPNSIAFFQKSNLVIMDKESYRTIPVSQFSASIPPTTSPPTALADASSVTQNPKLDSKVAGGFTALGIVIGSALTFLLYLLWKRCSRPKPETGTRDIKASRDSGTGLEEGPTSPIETVVVPQVPVVYRPIHQHFAKRKSIRPTLIDSRVGEGDPASDIAIILNNKCLVNPKEVGVVSTNPLHHQEVYIRKCRYGDNHIPALIHYFRHIEGERKFNRALNVLAALDDQNTENIIKFIDAVQLKLNTNADRGFKYMLITSYYEPNQSLAALYQQAISGDTVVDVKNETFIVWTIYSILLAVRDLHRAGFVHRFITADCFYAKSYSPTTDWFLADFDESGIAGDPYMMPADRCEYYDLTFNSTTFHYESDIWALGRVIYKVVSGGCQFQTDSSTDYSDYIEEKVYDKAYGRHYRDLLNSTLCNQRLTADQLVELWETRFDFNGI